MEEGYNNEVGGERQKYTVIQRKVDKLYSKSSFDNPILQEFNRIISSRGYSHLKRIEKIEGLLKDSYSNLSSEEKSYIQAALNIQRRQISKNKRKVKNSSEVLDSLYNLKKNLGFDYALGSEALNNDYSRPQSESLESSLNEKTLVESSFDGSSSKDLESLTSDNEGYLANIDKETGVLIPTLEGREEYLNKFFGKREKKKKVLAYLRDVGVAAGFCAAMALGYLGFNSKNSNYSYGKSVATAGYNVSNSLVSEEKKEIKPKPIVDPVFAEKIEKRSIENLVNEKLQEPFKSIKEELKKKENKDFIFYAPLSVPNNKDTNENKNSDAGELKFGLLPKMDNNYSVDKKSNDYLDNKVEDFKDSPKSSDNSNLIRNESFREANNEKVSNDGFVSYKVSSVDSKKESSDNNGERGYPSWMMKDRANFYFEKGKPVEGHITRIGGVLSHINRAANGVSNFVLGGIGKLFGGKGGEKTMKEASNFFWRNAPLGPNSMKNYGDILYIASLGSLNFNDKSYPKDPYVKDDGLAGAATRIATHWLLYEGIDCLTSGSSDGGAVGGFERGGGDIGGGLGRVGGSI